MPYKKRSFRRRKKRVYRKRKKRYGNRRSVIRLPMNMPDLALIKMKFTQNFTMANLTGFGTQIFRLNSIADPDFTSSGTDQPLGHDQWQAFYNSYEVLASKITFQALPPDVNPVRMVVFPSETSTGIASFTNASNQRYAKMRIINNTTISGRGNSLTSYMKVSKLEGRNTSSVNFTANFDSSPVNSRFWQVSLASMTATDISDIPCIVTIVYYCRLFKRITLATSS